MNINVFNLNREQFLGELDKRVLPERIYENAPEIYTYLAQIFKQNCNDSVLREWTFQWASDKLKVDYDKIYEYWLNG